MQLRLFLIHIHVTWICQGCKFFVLNSRNSKTRIRCRKLMVNPSDKFLLTKLTAMYETFLEKSHSNLSGEKFITYLTGSLDAIFTSSSQGQLDILHVFTTRFPKLTSHPRRRSDLFYPVPICVNANIISIQYNTDIWLISLYVQFNHIVDWK